MPRKKIVKPVRSISGVGKMDRAYLESDEVARLQKSATNLRDRLLIRLLFHLGCRVSEALGLDVKDIDFTRGMVTIQHLKSRIKLECHQCGARLGKSHSFCPKCGVRVNRAIVSQQEHRKMRALPLDRDSLQMLGTGWVAKMESERTKAGLARAISQG